MMTLIDASESRRIEAAVKAAEAKSEMELVVAVVKRSGDYSFEALLAAVAWAVAALVAILHFRPALDPLWAVAAALVVGIVAFVVFRVPAVVRYLVPARLAEHNVHQRAFGLFAEHGIHRTRHRTGMLIMVSELERRVVILGDTGIHREVEDEGWRAHVDHIVASIRKGDAASGIVDVIERLAKVHAELVPRGPDDTNELPDEIVRE